MEHSIKHLNVSRETFNKTDQLIKDHTSRLETYIDRLFWWNERINLISRDVSRETIFEHIRHSLLLSQVNAFKKASLIVDAGMGGGLPGIPLALTHPDKQFLLNDIVSKKCLAVKQMARTLELKNTGIADASIENIQPKESFLLVSKHAFKINDLYKMTVHLPWSTMVLYKGEEFESELENIEDPLEIKCHHLSIGEDFYIGKSLLVVHR